jgi:hypothetical protein
MNDTEKIELGATRLDFLSNTAADGPWMLCADEPAYLLSPQACNGAGCPCEGKGYVMVAWHQAPGDGVYSAATSPSFGLKVAELLMAIAADSAHSELRSKALEVVEGIDDSMRDAFETLAKAASAE